MRHANGTLLNRRTQPARTFRPCLEALESRVVPYTTSGNAWPKPELITLGWVSNYTVVGSTGLLPIKSTLISAFNGRFGSGVWEKELLRAAQVWAEQTNINFGYLTGGTTSIGSGSYQQGDPALADIRIGGYPFGASNINLGQAYYPPPSNTTSIAGDYQFNLSQTFTLSGTTPYNLFTVAAHEFGHVLGLAHSTSTAAQMYANYNGAKLTLHSDDVAGIRAIYSGGAARAKDSYDTSAANSTFASASNITSKVSTTSKTAVMNNLDLTSNSLSGTVDVDYYKVTAPTGSTTLKVRVQTQGLSLMSPRVEVYASNQTTLLGSATAAGDYDGATLNVTLSSATAGATYYIKVSGAETQSGSWQAFNSGRYGLALSFTSTSVPTIPLPNTQVASSGTPNAGGGEAGDVALRAAVPHGFAPEGVDCHHDHNHDHEPNASDEPEGCCEGEGCGSDPVTGRKQGAPFCDWVTVANFTDESSEGCGVETGGLHDSALDGVGEVSPSLSDDPTPEVGADPALVLDAWATLPSRSDNAESEDLAQDAVDALFAGFDGGLV